MDLLHVFDKEVLNVFLQCKKKKIKKQRSGKEATRPLLVERAVQRL